MIGGVHDMALSPKAGRERRSARVRADREVHMRQLGGVCAGKRLPGKHTHFPMWLAVLRLQHGRAAPAYLESP